MFLKVPTDCIELILNKCDAKSLISLRLLYKSFRDYSVGNWDIIKLPCAVEELDDVLPILTGLHFIFEITVLDKYLDIAKKKIMTLPKGKGVVIKIIPIIELIAQATNLNFMLISDGCRKLIYSV